jgi:glycosyltransferase involved in cell wall biosynthesis
MPPRVTYWSHNWDPDKEAISKEIAALRVDGRSRAPVVAFSPEQPTHFRIRDRVITLSGRRWIALRILAAGIEPLGDITHIFGGSSSWHLFRSLGRRPIVLTSVVLGAHDTGSDYSHLSAVVIEAEVQAHEWLSAGVSKEKIYRIFPGVDLTVYTPQAVSGDPAQKVNLLFASSPSNIDEIALRGVPLLVELARHRSDVEITIPWRRWGNVEATQKRLGELRPPSNFNVVFEDVVDMRRYYARSHAAIACFATSSGKACPNFVVEALAMGRPCILTSNIGIAETVANAGAGIVCESSLESVSTAVDKLKTQWAQLAANARNLAEAQFSAGQFRRGYENLYQHLATPRTRRFKG